MMKMDILAESAVRVTVLAVGVVVVLRTLRIRSPRLAHGVWTAVIAVMLLLPIAVAWGPEFAVPLLPSDAANALQLPAAHDIAAVASSEIPVESSLDTDRAHTRITWSITVGAAYAIGAGFFLLRLALGVWRARAIRRGAVHIRGRLTHSTCVTPITVGVVAPAVILPTDWPDWGAAELSAVLTHEEEHARARDPLVGFIALLNRAIFWFHPLAWWLQREIGRLSEEACDAVVISHGHDSQLYSTCLVRFARRAADAGGRIVPMATAMPGSGLQNRLQRLGDPPPVQSSMVHLASAVTLSAALVVVCTAATPTAAPVQNVPSVPNRATWPVRTSEHFEISHDSLPADRVEDAVGAAEAAYTQLSAALKHDLSRPVPIILLLRDRELPATEARASDLARQSGASTADHRLLISLESLDRDTGAIVHELTHQFAFDIVPTTCLVAPVLIEGLAEYQRGAWASKDLLMAREAAATGALPSLANLDGGDRHWAHALFDFVATVDGDEGVRKLLFALRARDTLVQAVPMAFGVTFDRFDQEFRGYVMTRYGQP
jgi:beta-lactamase regulating signal transducer with metallopeptidase domain